MPALFLFGGRNIFLEKLEKYVKYTSYNIKILNPCSFSFSSVCLICASLIYICCFSVADQGMTYGYFVHPRNVLMLLAQGAMNMADSLATANPVLTPVSAPEMNMLDMAVKGGWIMIVLGVLSVVCFYILFERNYMIRKAGKEDPMFMERIKDYIHSGEIKAAIQYCRTMNTPSARMIEKGISRLGRPINDVQVAIENVGNIEVAKLEKGLTVMATISGGAPMLGFLGTVTGMVRAFYEMANAGSGNIDITLLSGGIYEAMITTVGGLIVGIIAMFAYNYLVMLVDRVVNKMEARTMEFMDLLNEPAQK